MRGAKRVVVTSIIGRCESCGVLNGRATGQPRVRGSHWFCGSCGVALSGWCRYADNVAACAGERVIVARPEVGA